MTSNEWNARSLDTQRFIELAGGSSGGGGGYGASATATLHHHHLHHQSHAESGGVHARRR
jgi:hypothetical protein